MPYDAGIRRSDFVSDRSAGVDFMKATPLVDETRLEKSRTCTHSALLTLVGQFDDAVVPLAVSFMVLA